MKTYTINKQFALFRPEDTPDGIISYSEASTRAEAVQYHRTPWDQLEKMGFKVKPVTVKLETQD